MTEEAKQIIETLKQADKIFDAMELPEEEYAFTFDRYAVMTLVAEIERFERERDAAVKDIPRACGYCKHYLGDQSFVNCEHECMNISGINTGWQWRGVNQQ